MLSMNRRKLLWWGRLLLLLPIVYFLLINFVLTMLERAYGTEFILSWDHMALFTVTGLLMGIAPLFYLFAHHPFEEVPAGKTEKSEGSAKLIWWLLVFIWIGICVSLSYSEQLLKLNIIQGTISWLNNVSENSAVLLFLVDDWIWPITAILTFKKYKEASGWNVFRYWTLKFPPEEYPPKNTNEKTRKDTKITIYGI